MDVKLQFILPMLEMHELYYLANQHFHQIYYYPKNQNHTTVLKEEDTINSIITVTIPQEVND